MSVQLTIWLFRQIRFHLWYDLHLSNFDLINDYFHHSNFNLARILFIKTSMTIWPSDYWTVGPCFSLLNPSLKVILYKSLPRRLKVQFKNSIFQKRNYEHMRSILWAHEVYTRFMTWTDHKVYTRFMTRTHHEAFTPFVTWAHELCIGSWHEHIMRCTLSW